jgi:hypothetical protein
MKIIKPSISLLQIINRGFNYVVETSNLYKIDESHALKHSMDVYQFAKKIYKSELNQYPYLHDQQKIIYLAAIGHDMCDKKYMNETEGIIKYQNYLEGYMSFNDLDVMGKIIGTMSYSKVKKHGYPNLGEYQLAYHIVREADLLAAYDIDRSIIYNMYKGNNCYSEALKDSLDLFDNRVFTMMEHNLFITDYSKTEATNLHLNAKKNIKSLEDIWCEV